MTLTQHLHGVKKVTLYTIEKNCINDPYRIYYSRNIAITTKDGTELRMVLFSENKEELKFINNKTAR